MKIYCPDSLKNGPASLVEQYRRSKLPVEGFFLHLGFPELVSANAIFCESYLNGTIAEGVRLSGTHPPLCFCVHLK